MMEFDDILKELKSIVGQGKVLTDEETLERYSKDESYQPAKRPDCVVSVKSTEEVQKVVKIANENSLPVVPRSSPVGFHGSGIPGEGGIVIDTPGLREIQIWGGEGGLDRVFNEIEALAKRCRFRDCTHAGEPGCAVLAAVESGELEIKRLENYRKLQKEVEFLERRKNAKKTRQADRDFDKRIRQYHQTVKEIRKKNRMW